MAVQQVQFNFENIDDQQGIESIMTALLNIDGVSSVELMTDKNIGLVKYEDTDTSFHAIKAAVNTVDYVTQPFPEDAPQNPDNE